MVASKQRSIDFATDETLDNVGDYQFEPIKGYPMLHWKGKRPFRSTQYYPAQLKEVHGEAVEGWRNKIYWSDNLQVMSHLLKEFRGKVDLVYIDPPFDSKADYKKRVGLKGKLALNDRTVFEEKQYTDIWTNDEYLQFLYERLILIRELMSEEGSIYIHLGPNISHYCKILVDEVFGTQNYINEIIWRRAFAHNDSNRCGVIHDSILLYSKSANYIWNTVRQAPDPEYVKTFFDQVDKSTGKRYQRIPLTAPGITREGESGKPWRGIDPSKIGRHWSKSRAELERLDEEGRIHWPKSEDGVPRLKRFEDEYEGMVIQDIWTDISKIHNQSPELIGYPTQKPEALLERIISASSNPGDLVFDCFMGSGTTQAVATKLGRRFIGADINLGAVQITTKRLLGIASELEEQQGKLVEDEEPTTYYTGFEVYNVNHYDLFRNPLEAKDILLQALEVQPLEQGHLFDGMKDGRMIKIMPVNRIATRADLNELTSGFDYKAFEKRQKEAPTKPVEKITLVCMGHEPDLAAVLKKEAQPFNIDVEVVDILRDKSNLEFKRDSEAKVAVKGKHLVIEKFYPMNLLQKLSLQQENVEDWRELVESIMIDWNYDGAILEPKEVDIPDKNDLVKGKYKIPDDAGTIRIKITDLLSESLEVEVQHG
jgi:adenine-specific DNA-methyltransferase